MPSPNHNLGNRNATLLRQEFKRRYLTEFSSYVGGLMEESGGHAANFLFLFAVIAVGSVSFPIAALLGAGISARYAQVRKGVAAALEEARGRVAAELQSEDGAKLPHVERWLDAHLEDLPGYLDKLDRYEEERRKVKSLVDKTNRSGSAASLTAKDRALLKRHGVKSFTPPLYPLYTLPPRYQLGNWHFSELDRALWRDIAALAGPGGRMMGRMAGFGETHPSRPHSESC
jgi:hypothetical protein